MKATPLGKKGRKPGDQIRWAPPSTNYGKPISVGDRLITFGGNYHERVMKVLEVDEHCGNSSDILVTPEKDPGPNEARIRVHGSFFVHADDAEAVAKLRKRPPV